MQRGCRNLRAQRATPTLPRMRRGGGRQRPDPHLTPHARRERRGRGCDPTDIHHGDWVDALAAGLGRALCAAGPARPADRHLAAAVSRAGGASRWPVPAGPIRCCCCCSRSARWRCAAPAAPSTTSPTASMTARSRAPGCGRCRAAGSRCAQAVALHAGAAGGRRRRAVQPQPAGDRARRGGARADRHLSVHEADHLVAAALSWAQLQLGRADRLGRGDRHRSPGRRCCSISAASAGRSATTRSTPIRTRRTTPGSASNPRPWRWASAPGPFSSSFYAAAPRCGRAAGIAAGLGVAVLGRARRRRGSAAWQAARVDTDDPADCLPSSARTGWSAGCCSPASSPGHFA